MKDMKPDSSKMETTDHRAVMPSLGAAAGSGRGSDTRKIRVRCWVQAWGQEIERVVEMNSPSVSNMPCPVIQRKADEALAGMVISFGVKTGFDILPNDKVRDAG